MRGHSWRTRLSVAAVLLLACTERATDPDFTSPVTPPGLRIPVPESIVVNVCNNVVLLQWALPDGLPDSETPDAYDIFRKRLDVLTPESEQFLGRVQTQEFTDNQPRNNNVYEYTIRSVKGQLRGQRSEPVQARPNAFTIEIANGVAKTRNRTVQVALAAPGAQTVCLSEDPLNCAPRAFANPISWTFAAADDGVKTIYAIFQLLDGSETCAVQDSVLLDTRAAIVSVDFEGPDVRIPGDMLHFKLDAAETGGTASLVVQGVFTSLALFDDGSHGDTQAADGVYENNSANSVVPPGVTITRASVRGSFTDEVGNQATDLVGPKTLTVMQAPDPVELIDPAIVTVPPAAAAVTLRWSQSLDTDFTAYEVFRSAASPVDSSGESVCNVRSRGQLDCTDHDVIEGRTYFYRVYVRNNSGLLVGSNQIQTLIPNERPPVPVTLESPEVLGASRIALRWARSADRDFRAYRVYRDDVDDPSGQQSLIQRITDVNRTFWDDAGLVDNTRYRFFVETIDQDSLSSRSNSREAITLNEPPTAVTLMQPSVDSTSALLTWTESDAHDFAEYRVYRDATEVVTPGASQLVFENDERDWTTFRDVSLSPDSTYCYRVFVVDDGTDPGPLSAGSASVCVTTPVDSLGVIHHASDARKKEGK